MPIETPTRPSTNTAIKWAFVMNWSQRITSALVSLGLSVFLGPTIFGTVAMATGLISAAQVVVEQGVLSTLVRTKTLPAIRISTAFFIVVLSSIAACISVASLAPVWAALNKLPELTTVIWALCPAVVFDGVSVTPRALLQREMNFRALSASTAIGVIAGGIVGACSAAMGLGIWAIVVQVLTDRALSAITALVLCRWVPKWIFSVEEAKNLLSFSFRMFLLKIMVFVHTEADVLLIGYLYGPLTTGVYRLAQRATNLLIDGLTGSLQIVALSEFSQLQDQPEHLRKKLTVLLRISCAITIPAVSLLAVASDSIVAMCGPKWHGAGLAFRYLALAGGAYSVVAFTSPLFTAIGRPGAMTFITGIMAAANVAILFASSYLKGGNETDQATGVAVARIVANYCVMFPLLVAAMMKASGLKMKEMTGAIRPAIIIALGAISLPLVLRVPLLNSGTGTALVLGVQLLAGTAAGIATAWRFDEIAKDQIAGVIARVHREYL